jgi:serine/threonine protein kinase
VLTQGHDKSADYWAYGILIFELLCGHTPFEGRNQQRTFEKIVHSQKHLAFPPSFDPHCKSFIRRLLHPNPALRLGALQNGFKDIQKHAFFTTQSIEFDRLMDEEYEMPYIPKQMSEAELMRPGDSDVDVIDFDEEANAAVADDFMEQFSNLSTLDVNDNL